MSYLEYRRLSGRMAVIERLLKGERLRTGYTFTGKAWFDNGDVVFGNVMKRLKDEGRIEQDRDGFIALAKEVAK